MRSFGLLPMPSIRSLSDLDVYIFVVSERDYRSHVTVSVLFKIVVMEWAFFKACLADCLCILLGYMETVNYEF